MTEDVQRQTDREKQLQQRYAELVEELKELSRQGNTEAVYENGNSATENEVEAQVETHVDAVVEAEVVEAEAVAEN